MVNKRRQQDLESDQEAEGSGSEAHSTSPSPSHPKRARHEAEDPDEERQRMKRADAEAEARWEEKMRVELHNQAKRKGGIAEIGIIQQIDLYNFLCHKNLTVKFGPQINFVIGHNGSGKSAVLTAIAVGLGGKAAMTGRGNGLKSLIKEGESAAEVSIRIKNEGPEAYKPNIYGKSIMITRHFTASGSSGYKIKSTLEGRKGHEKVVSTMRDELNAITDHMGIQVDNPLNILTQDLSRQFIASSSPAEKYQFFLKGTQLQQLSEEYNTILENIDRTTGVLGAKQEAIPELRVQFKEAQARWTQATEMRKNENKLQELLKELAWAYVAAKEKEFAKSGETLTDERRQLDKLEAKASEQEAMHKDIEREIEEAEIELRSASESQTDRLTALKDEKERYKGEGKALNDQLEEIKSQRLGLQEEAKKAKAEIDLYKRKIADEQKKLDDIKSGKRIGLEKRMRTLQESIESDNHALQECDVELQSLGLRTTEVETEVNRKTQEKTQAIRDQQASQDLSRLYEGQLRNKLNAFGSNIPQVHASIKQESWLGGAPIGPIGAYVDLLDRKYIDLVRLTVGNLMSSWVVTTGADQRKLRKILDASGNQQSNTIVTGAELFDYSEGEPPAQIPTVLRVLKFSNELVKRVLINVARVEQTCFADTRLAADSTLQELRAQGIHGFKFFTLDGFQVQRYREGGGSSIGLDKLGRVFPGLFAGSEGDVRQKHQEAAQKAVQLTTVVENLSTEIMRVREDLRVVENRKFEIQRSQRQLRNEVARKEEDLRLCRSELSVGQPAEIDVFEQQLEIQERERERFLADITEIAQKEIDVQAQRSRVQESIAMVDQRVFELRNATKHLSDKIQDLVPQRVEAGSKLKHWREKILTAKEKVGKLEVDTATLQEEFTDWTTKAEGRYGERIERPRSVDTLEKIRDQLRASIKNQVKTLGATIEELDAEVIRTKDVYARAKKEFEELQRLNACLKKSLSIRMEQWANFRRHIAIRCKMQFSYHLANRGYYGKVIMEHNTDHHGGTLNLKVQTDDQAGTGGSRDKDPKSLSGGEKSFATICLLLALWEAIGCPIRCLDEFDVFMDAINRKISMKMIIETAKQSDSRQFVLITPLDISNVPRSSEIRIHRMLDPERGQTNLNFS